MAHNCSQGGNNRGPALTAPGCAPAVLFTRTSAAIRRRSLQTIEAEFTQNDIPMFGIQIHERDAYRALFSFGGTLSDLDSSRVSNIKAAATNARAFAAEVVALLKAKVPTKKPRR